MGRDNILQAVLQLIDHADDIEVLPRTARTGDEIHPLAANVQALENIEAHLDFLHRIGRQGDPQGVTDALIEEHA